MTTPVVSVVIPTYNQPRLLLRTLETVFAQTFTDFEVVVVNDGSTDDTAEQLEPLVRREGGRLRVIQQSNGGIGAARNRGVDEARGEYIALLDHDDLWLPDKLRAQVDFLNSHPDCVAVTVPWAYSTDPGRCVFDRSSVVNARGIISRPLKAQADGHWILVSSSMMFRRQQTADLRFETPRQTFEDYPFQIKLFTRGALGVAGDSILMTYTLHAGNASSHAINHFYGIRDMRAMNRAGVFKTVDSQQRADLSAFLAHVGRTAAVMQLLAGYRMRGVRAYVGEFVHQAREGRLKFLAIFPLLVLTPQRTLRGRWDGRPR